VRSWTSHLSVRQLCRIRILSTPGFTEWINDCCICSSCIELDGIRNAGATVPSISRLFLGDVVWLYFMERMGIPQIVGAILDSYACNGRLPISNGSLEAGLKDDVTALVLEGDDAARSRPECHRLSVTGRACIERTLGWTSDAGRKLNLDTSLNSGFHTAVSQSSSITRLNSSKTSVSRSRSAELPHRLHRRRLQHSSRSATRSTSSRSASSRSSTAAITTTLSAE
jgi:hypothetical protein